MKGLGLRRPGRRQGRSHADMLQDTCKQTWWKTCQGTFVLQRHVGDIKSRGDKSGDVVGLGLRRQARRHFSISLCIECLFIFACLMVTIEMATETTSLTTLSPGLIGCVVQRLTLSPGLIVFWFRDDPSLLVLQSSGSETNPLSWSYLLCGAETNPLSWSYWLCG